MSDQQWQPPGDWDLGSWEERLQGSLPTSDATVTAEWWRRVIALLLDNLLLYAVSALVGLQATSSSAVADLRVVAELALTFCYFGYLNGVIVYGTTEAVTDQLIRLRDEMFLDYLLCAPLSHESFTLFTDKVLPRLA